MNVAGVLLNVILLCVCFRAAKYSLHCAALHCDEDHYLDYLLVTVAVTGQLGFTPASSKLPSSLLGGLMVCLGLIDQLKRFRFSVSKITGKMATNV